MSVRTSTNSRTEGSGTARDARGGAVDIVVTLMGEPGVRIAIRTYGGLEEAALNALEVRARQAGFQVEPRQPLTGATLGDLLRQILANLSGLEESAVPEPSVRELVEALTLKALA